jgi:hypothetical protein
MKAYLYKMHNLQQQKVEAAFQLDKKNLATTMVPTTIPSKNYGQMWGTNCSPPNQSFN